MTNSIILKNNQTVKDIAAAIITAIAINFRNVQIKSLPKMPAYEFAKYLFYYCIENFEYKAETDSLQTVKSLNRILTDKTNDCKHYTIYIASILLAKGYDVEIKFINQHYYKSNDWHVYPILLDGNKSIILDCVYGQFDSEPTYIQSKSIIINQKK